MSVEGDVDVHVVAVYGVVSLPLVEPDPNLVVELQRQHDALALHDGAVTGLRVQDHLLLLIVHQVQVRLLEVPGVNVDVEEIDSWDEAVELALEHVEVFAQVNEDGVEDHGLVVIGAVKSFASAHGERRLLDFAGVSGGPGVSFTAFGPHHTSESMGSVDSGFARRPSVPTLSFFPCQQSIKISI